MALTWMELAGIILNMNPDHQNNPVEVVTTIPGSLHHLKGVGQQLRMDMNEPPHLVVHLQPKEEQRVQGQ